MDTRLIILIVFTITTVVCADSTQNCQQIDDSCGNAGKCATGCVPRTTQAKRKRRDAATPVCSPVCQSTEQCQWKCDGGDIETTSPSKSGTNRNMFSLHIFLLAMTTTLFFVH